MLRCLLRSQAGLPCCVCGGAERASRARSHAALACGGDDYLFILLDGISQVRAIASPAAAAAAAAAAIAALLLLSACACSVLLTHALCPWPSQAVDCSRMRTALGSWGGG